MANTISINCATSSCFNNPKTYPTLQLVDSFSLLVLCMKRYDNDNDNEHNFIKHKDSL